ncbi:hypothetical protein ACA910_002748 [Epithemia clementina (nom. ined.)]
MMASLSIIVAFSVLLLDVSDGFQLAPRHVSTTILPSSKSSGRHHEQILVRLASKNKGSDGDKQTDETEQDENNNNFFPSFLNRLKRGVSRPSDSDEQASATTTTSTLTRMDATSNPTGQMKASSSSSGRSELSPLEKAQQLRAQADRARLEAERMDAELTLQKIARLERELAHAKAKGSDSVEALQKQMAALQGKLSGDKNNTAAPRSTTSKASTSKTVSAGDVKWKDTSKGIYTSSLPSHVEPFNQKEFDDVLAFFNETPGFFKKLMCAQLGFKYPSDGNVNATEVALRLDEIRRFDFSFSKDPRPKFTKTEIEKMEERLKANWLTSENAYVPDGRLKKAAGGNNTELALLCLEYEYYNDKYVVDEQRMASMLLEPTVINEIATLGTGMYDDLTESLLPPCTRKEDKQPTLAQAEKLVKDILPKAQFTSTAKPTAVPGGYIIKGESKAIDGDALISAIDQQIEKSSLRGKVTVCFLDDFIPILSDDMDEEILFGEKDGGILFVGGPDLVREPRKVLLSATSALGLATCWYLSLYPFLLNPTLAQRVDEQLALVEANMPADLSWLTDLSFPLFATFVGLQVLHELGHRIAATFTDIKPTFPTFVPSIITGVTSVTTSFKEPPKNLQAMFDFSIAGPLFGMIGSIVAIFLGTLLSVSADPTNFPALPLEILMQSSLGGGIIEYIMGPGVVSVPDALRGSQAVAAMTIRLHPVAVAGYISLVVNALSMLPIGSTDGGRIAMALFGRKTKLAIGSLAMFIILLLGIQGSDLLLFYYAFCLAFQKGNEIPCRNEVDTVDFSRVLVATATYFLALLALIPIQ